MSYSDQKHYTPNDIVIAALGTATFGAVASAASATVTGVAGAGWKAPLAYKVIAASANCRVAPSSSVQPIAIAVMDGTSTIATLVTTTFTAGQAAAMTMTTASALVAAGDVLTLNAYGTTTASVGAGQVVGTYDIELQLNKQFV